MDQTLDVENSILEAINNPVWDYRTKNGIFIESGASLDQIDSTLEKHKDFVKQAPFRSKSGESIYYSKYRRSKLRVYLDAFRSFR